MTLPHTVKAGRHNGTSLIHVQVDYRITLKPVYQLRTEISFYRKMIGFDV
jgi:hypothetical protein